MKQYTLEELSTIGTQVNFEKAYLSYRCVDWFKDEQHCNMSFSKIFEIKGLPILFSDDTYIVLDEIEYKGKNFYMVSISELKNKGILQPTKKLVGYKLKNEKSEELYKLITKNTNTDLIGNYHFEFGSNTYKILKNYDILEQLCVPVYKEINNAPISMSLGSKDFNFTVKPDVSYVEVEGGRIEIDQLARLIKPSMDKIGLWAVEFASETDRIFKIGCALYSREELTKIIITHNGFQKKWFPDNV